MTNLRDLRDRPYYSVRLGYLHIGLPNVQSCIVKAKSFMSLHYIVTFKDLQKLVQSQSSPEQSQLLQRLRDKPFWIWDQQQHRQEDIKTKGDCCFNHIIGLPIKNKVEKPLFDYEQLLYDSVLLHS